MLFFFCIFATLVIISAIMVVFSKNSVHSVLWLIFTFCNASGLILLLGAEFLAMLLIIVYVGAVAVLFLFTIMMIDKGEEYKNDNCFSLSMLISVLLFLNLLFIFYVSKKTSFVDNVIVPNNISNIKLIARTLYTDYMVPLQIIGMILLSAMVGSIALTVHLGRFSNLQKLKYAKGKMFSMDRNRENSLDLSLKRE